MKTAKTLFIALLLVTVAPISAQTADEIIDNYFETTGGKDNWGNLEAIKISGSVSAQGMEIPVDVIQTKDGKQLVTINFQGQEIKQMAFDGETLHEIAPNAVTAVDSNGAGDMFAGAFLYAITNGHSYADAGKLASLASSKIAVA